jgi:hypothetical protein
MVRIFKNRWFSRFAAKAGITDDELKAVVEDLEAGRFDADLGGDVYKQRVARQGGGKSGGFRTIVIFKNQFRTFFVYGFAKAERDNIKDNELEDFKDAAPDNFKLTDKQLNERVKDGSLIEII